MAEKSPNEKLDEIMRKLSPAKEPDEKEKAKEEMARLLAKFDPEDRERLIQLVSQDIITTIKDEIQKAIDEQLAKLNEIKWKIEEMRGNTPGQ